MALADEDDSGEASICTMPEHAPIYYHWYPRVSGERPIDAFRQILADVGLNSTETEYFVGVLRGTMNLLKQGRMRPLHEIKGPMRIETRLRVFEIRLSHEYKDVAGTRKELHVRFYHVEPTPWASTSRGSTVLGLHVHHKDIDADEVLDDQDDAIREAARRYFEGRATQWGLPHR